MGTTLEVWPVEGRTMVREDAPQRRIVGKTTVPNTTYYRRALERGDLHDEAAHKAARDAAKKAPSAAKEG